MKKIESSKKMISTKKLVVLMLISLLALSCAPDIYVDPPDSLRGFYIGKYYVSHALAGATVTKWDEVEWSFTDQQHFCDFIVPEGSERKFCDFSGLYTVESNLTLGSLTIANQICVVDDVPEGIFSISWTRVEDGNDILTLEQIDYGEDYRKWAVLEKQPAPE